MKKLLIGFAVIGFFAVGASFFSVTAKETVKLDLDPVACESVGNVEALCTFYTAQKRPEACASSLEEFKKNPALYHFWIQDPDVTSQGKANERARQFIAWVFSKNAIDDHPTIKSVWNVTRNIAYFFVILIAAILGIGFIVGQRTNFDMKIKVWPAIGKIAGALLFITFSASIVLLLIQLSEIFMKFFIENLGVKDFFNIYFSSSTSQEISYTTFTGCRDLNYGAQEAGKTQLFLMQLTNITYYIMGVMLILRKIILWLLLFVSPFLAILFPFVVIRNVGWIWIGVFFQWLMYGPLFALFLGALARIWKNGIPFVFDFSRTNASDGSGYIYPTALNILYGGPAQKLSIFNNGSYVDTFIEYVITLIMLWAVIFFPWFLLRYFRSYCCDGIYAMKNILYSLYDQMRNNPPTPPTQPSLPSLSGQLKVEKDIPVNISQRLETIEEIKRTKTEEISKTLNLSATKLTDVARFETNKETQEVVKRNLEYLGNPTKAESPTDRQKYMNLRTELFNRAIKEDVLAKQILSATASSGAEQIENRNKIVAVAPQLNSVMQVVSTQVKLSPEKVSSVNQSLASVLTAHATTMSTIAQGASVTVPQAQSIINSYKQHTQEVSSDVISAIVKDTGEEKEKVVQVLQKVVEALQTNKELAKEVAQKENIQAEAVEKIVHMQIPLVASPELHVEQSIAIPATISIEDYEEVKKMWTHQYEKGEVPVSENMTSRNQWLNQDIVFITNTLNKLVARDEKLRMQGLDEVGYILPIFMINNMKTGELLVYLKAKLEAAKVVMNQMEREKNITEKLKAKANEVFVDIPLPKQKEAEQTMTMANEQPLPESKPEGE